MNIELKQRALVGGEALSRQDEKKERKEEKSKKNKARKLVGKDIGPERYKIAINKSVCGPSYIKEK